MPTERRNQSSLFSSGYNEQKPYRVSEFLKKVERCLEEEYPMPIWIEGETSNLVKPRSGHWYFSLKDSEAQIRCVMFRRENAQVRFNPEDGLKVMAFCSVSLYSARGDLQVIVRRLDVIGEGALRLAFEKLHGKLEKEGLFDSRKKRLPPSFPRHIGVITSETGDAVRDVLTVLNRRYRLPQISILPSITQGARAADNLVKALRLAEAFNRQNSRNDGIDVLLMVRGGGSLEDLQAYNDEMLARAAAQCSIPIISGVGHETDFTILDYVADVRAATPSAAAELASRSGQEDLVLCQTLQQKLFQIITSLLGACSIHIGQYKKRLRDPRRQIEAWQQKLDDLTGRLRTGMQLKVTSSRYQLEQLAGKLTATSPGHLLEAARVRLNSLKSTLHGRMTHAQKQLRQSLSSCAFQLDSLSPLRTLNRGYAIVRQQSATITSVRQVEPGEPVAVFLGDGRMDCSVLDIDPNGKLSEG